MDRPNGLNISLTIQLSPEELSALPHETLARLAEIARQVCLAQAKPVLAELRRSMEVHKMEIESLKAFENQMQAFADASRDKITEPPDRDDLIDGGVIRNVPRDTDDGACTKPAAGKQ